MHKEPVAKMGMFVKNGTAATIGCIVHWGERKGEECRSARLELEWWVVGGDCPGLIFDVP